MKRERRHRKWKPATRWIKLYYVREFVAALRDGGWKDLPPAQRGFYALLMAEGCDCEDYARERADRALSSSFAKRLGERHAAQKEECKQTR